MCLFTARIHLVIKTCLIPFLICAHASAGLVAELYKYYTIEVVHTGSMTQVVCAGLSEGLKIRGAPSNVVGIICPLVEIGFTDPPNIGGVPTALNCIITKSYLVQLYCHK